MRPIFWLNNARYVSFPQSVLPAFVAIALAFGQPGFSWGLSLLAVFGCVMAHFGFNILDDYFDFRNNDGKVREKLAGMGMRSRIAKCSYIWSFCRWLPFPARLYGIAVILITGWR